MNQKPKYDLAGEIIGYAMAVHNELGQGFNESVYRNALLVELNEHGYEVEVEKHIKVFYRDVVVGSFAADLYINQSLIIELKAVQALITVHEAQLVNYLTATKTKQGLLINFGAPSLQFKKKFKDYKSTTKSPPELQA